MFNSYINEYGNVFSLIGLLASAILFARNAVIRRRNLIRRVTAWYYETSVENIPTWQEISRKIEVELIRYGYNTKVIGYRHIEEEVDVCRKLLDKFNNISPLPSLPERTKWYDWKNCRIQTVLYKAVKIFYMILIIIIIFILIIFTVNKEEIDILILFSQNNIILLISSIIIYPVGAYIYMAFIVRDSFGGQYDLDSLNGELPHRFIRGMILESPSSSETIHLSARQSGGYIKKYVDSYPGLFRGEFFSQRIYHRHQWKTIIFEDALKTVWIKYLIKKNAIVNGGIFYDTLEVEFDLPNEKLVKFNTILSVEDGKSKDSAWQELTSEIIRSINGEVIIRRHSHVLVLTAGYKLVYLNINGRTYNMGMA